MIGWIASYPKSGNTWMRALIEAWHLGEVDINDMRISSGDNDPYPYQIVAPVPIAELPIEEKLMLRPAALLHMAKIYHRRPLLLKTHHANIRTCGVDLIPPPATEWGIYLVRDPRDLVISLADNMGLTLDDAIERMERENWTIGRNDKPPHVLTDWSNHVTSWTDAEEFRVCTVRYEDMVIDPAGTFAQVLGFLNWRGTREKLIGAVEQAAFDKLWRQEESRGFKEGSPKAQRFFRHGTAGHWENILTPRQAARIESAHVDVMRRFGYLPPAVEAAA